MIVSRLRTTDTLGQIGHYGFGGPIDLDPTQGFRGFLDSAADGIGQLITGLNLINEPRLRKTLNAAGMYRTTPRTVIGYSLLCALAFPAAWIWLAVAVGMKTALAVLGVIFLAVLGWVGPGMVVQRRAEARLHRIDRAMPELIDLLVVTVEAGLSLSAALQLAGDRVRG